MFSTGDQALVHGEILTKRDLWNRCIIVWVLSHLLRSAYVFPASTKDFIFFQLSYPHLILWLLVWHRYSGPCSNVVILATLKVYVYLLAYLHSVWMDCTRSGRSISPSDTTLRRLQSRLETRSPGLAMLTAGGRTSPSVYLGQSRNGSVSSLTGNHENSAAHLPLSQ